jgi:hypothetical protein
MKTNGTHVYDVETPSTPLTDRALTNEHLHSPPRSTPSAKDDRTKRRLRRERRKNHIVENVEDVTVEDVTDSADERVLIIEEEFPDATPLFPLHEPDVSIGLQFLAKAGATSLTKKVTFLEKGEVTSKQKEERPPSLKKATYASVAKKGGATSEKGGATSLTKKRGATSIRTINWTKSLGKAINYIDEKERAMKERTMKTGIDHHKTVKHVVELLMTQMTAKQGVKEFGDRAVEAIIKEFTQLNEKNVFQPKHFGSLTMEDRKKALRSITLIKEKRCGRVKGRTVADGRPQRKYYAPEDVHSPTVSTEGLFLSLGIDAKEERHVATCDVEGAYLHASMEDVVIMMFEGDMVDYMVATDPKKYGPYVHVARNGKKILYVRLLKALYGCIQSAMLWWRLLTGTLEENGFKVNPYDTCVANKIMDDGTQCTVCWYVDDLKISHAKEKVVDDVINMIEDKYGKMTVTRGNKHIYLGMDIEFIGNGEVTILMKDYITEAIDVFPEDCGEACTSPGTTGLFHVDEKAKLLPEPERKLLHSLVAKLLFVSKRGRPDIQVPISFLTSRVTKADTDDWRKLKRVLQYLKGTIDMPLTLSIDNLSIVKTWVDAAFGVHADMRSHTGGTIMLGKGTFYASSKKQKMNTKSSTEAELVGAGDFLPQTIWTANFLRAQGYTVKENIYHQDNQSAMRMEKNGRQSAGPRSRHIDIRYFFIKDRIQRGEINLVYCPTGEMVADFFSKPLQGGLFKKFRDVVMGIRHPDALLDATPPGPGAC